MSDTIIDKLNECLKETDPEDDVIFVPRWYVDEAIEHIAVLEAVAETANNHVNTENPTVAFHATKRELIQALREAGVGEGT